MARAAGFGRRQRAPDAVAVARDDFQLRPRLGKQAGFGFVRGQRRARFGGDVARRDENRFGRNRLRLAFADAANAAQLRGRKQRGIANRANRRGRLFARSRRARRHIRFYFHRRALRVFGGRRRSRFAGRERTFGFRRQNLFRNRRGAQSRSGGILDLPAGLGRRGAVADFDASESGPAAPRRFRSASAEETK